MGIDGGSFFGTYTPRLDDKARLFLPAKFRPRLEGGIVLARGQEKCIYGWSTERFNSLTERISDAPFTSREARNFVRMLYSGAAQEIPDKQGRIPIPAALRSWAEIDRDVAVVGAMDRIEIWDAQRWETYAAEQEEPFSDMSDEVIPGIF